MGSEGACSVVRSAISSSRGQSQKAVCNVKHNTNNNNDKKSLKMNLNSEKKTHNQGHLAGSHSVGKMAL